MSVSHHLPRLALLVVLVAGLTAAFVVPAAAVPAKACGTVGSKGKRYSVRAHLITCDSARTKARAYLSNGSKPRGWRCVRYNPKVTRVVFQCYDPKTSSRSDGPKSFNASR